MLRVRRLGVRGLRVRLLAVGRPRLFLPRRVGGALAGLIARVRACRVGVGAEGQPWRGRGLRNLPCRFPVALTLVRRIHSGTPCPLRPREEGRTSACFRPRPRSAGPTLLTAPPSHSGLPDQRFRPRCPAQGHPAAPRRQRHQRLASRGPRPHLRRAALRPALLAHRPLRHVAQPPACGTSGTRRGRGAGHRRR